MATEKRALFQSRWMPYALVLPQLAITLVFFFWPAGQALYQSLLVEDAFGARTEFVWFENFTTLFNDPNYLASFRVTAIFSVLVAGIGLVASLILAAFADRVIRAATVYKTLLIVPYAVAPAIAAVLWLFLFNPTLGVVAHWMQRRGIEWDPLLNADQLQLPVSPRRPAGDSHVADRGGGDRRRRSGQAFRDDRVSAAVADDVLPARRQHHLRVHRDVRHHRRVDLGRPVEGDGDAGLQDLRRRLQGPRPRRIGRAIRHPHAHRHPVPVRRAESAVLNA